jgi:hypothetical protein
MNILKILGFIFKFGACLGLIRYTDDIMLQTIGCFLAIGFALEVVDILRNGNIMDNKGVENERRN